MCVCSIGLQHVTLCLVFGCRVAGEQEVCWWRGGDLITIDDVIVTNNNIHCAAENKPEHIVGLACLDHLSCAWNRSGLDRYI